MSSKQNLIILPGWAGNKMLWQHQCKSLRDIVNAKVIEISDQETVAKMASAVIKQAPDRFILVGHSLGGWVAQHIAINFPERVSKLVLLGTWTGDSKPELISLFKTLLQRIRNGETKEVLDELRPGIVHPQHRKNSRLLQLIKKSQNQFPITGLINQTLVEINGGDTSPYLHKIICPTLIIHARQDPFFSLKIQKLIKSKIPHAKLTIIEDCGHMIQIEQPQALSALLRLWIDADFATQG
ncbi:MAG: alpha/beta hydrolase [Tatlockia sp.]|nr:alpha/beta hydrolase [Tatlockia sp.]